MFKIIQLIALFTLCLSTSSLTAQPVDDWATFEYGDFSIQHPKDWTTSVGKSGTEFMLYAPLDNDGQDLYLEIVALRLMGFYEDLDDQALNFKVYLLDAGYDIMLAEQKSKNNRAYNFFEYKGMQGDFELHFLEYQWSIGEEHIQLSFLGEEKRIEKYRELALQIMDTFRKKDQL